MQLSRLFFSDKYKGTRNYLSSQKKYEIIRTCLYFGISLCLFAVGYLTTKTRINLLTLVAVLGCLPASKSAVGMIMFLRFQGCEKKAAAIIADKMNGLCGLFDCVFTSYQRNYNIAHLTVKGNTICGYTQDDSLDENAFYKHLEDILKMDGLTNITIKVYKDLNKYLQRVEQMKNLDTDESNTQAILSTLKNVSL